MYTITKRVAASGASADNAIASLWNPHGTQRIKLLQFALVAGNTAPATGCTLKLRRISGRGTCTSLAGTIYNHSLKSIAPVSVSCIDYTYTVQPTFETGDLGLGWVLPIVAAAGVIYPIPGGIEIPPGAGLCICTGSAILVPACDVTFVWLEDW